MTPSTSPVRMPDDSAILIGCAVIAGTGFAMVCCAFARDVVTEPGRQVASSICATETKIPAHFHPSARSDQTPKAVRFTDGVSADEVSESADAAGQTDELTVWSLAAGESTARIPLLEPIHFKTSVPDSELLTADGTHSIVLQVAHSVEPAEKVASQPVPDTNLQKKSEREIRQVFQQEYSNAKTAAQKSELARTLIDHAANSSDDPVAQYVLLREARELTAEVGDAVTAFRAVEEMGATFEIDVLFAKRGVLIEAAKAKLRGGARRKFVETVLVVIDEAVAADRFDVATRLCRVATAAARKAGDRRLTKHISDLRKEIGSLFSEHQAAQRAAEILRENPDDPAANLARGRFLCLIKNEWKLGLPMLLKGGDPGLKSLAEQELNFPSNTGAQVDLAGQWWRQSDNIRSSLKDASRERAVFWYEQALPKLSGLEQAAIAKKIRAYSDGRRPDWKFEGFGRFVSETGSFNHPRIPDELTTEYKSGEARISGVCRHDVVRIDGQKCGWFGKAILWQVRRPSMINARLQLTFRTPSENDRIFLLDARKRLLKNIVMPGVRVGAKRTVSFRYDPIAQAIAVEMEGEKQPTLRDAVSMQRSESLFIGYGAVVRSPGDKMDVSIRVVGTKATRD